MQKLLRALTGVIAGVFFGLTLSAGLSLALASRNSSGTYSLPAGNPVTTGTTITSTWANNTLNDLKTEMTDSLSRSGKGAMLAGLALVDGAVGAPGVTWANEATSGLYRAGANDVRMSIGGAAVQKWNAGATTLLGTVNTGGGQLLSNCGSAALDPCVTVTGSTAGTIALSVVGGAVGTGEALKVQGASGAGALGALFVGGSTSPVIQINPFAGGNGLTITASSGNSTAAIVTGNGTGAGINATSGNSSTATAVIGTGGASGTRGGQFQGGGGSGGQGALLKTDDTTNPTAAAVNLLPTTNAPTNLSNGDLWFRGATTAMTLEAQLNGATVTVASTRTKSGQCTLGTNCNAITVVTGAQCLCTDTTAAAACKAVVAATTLTITGTGTDVINYLCF